MFNIGKLNIRRKQLTEYLVSHKACGDHDGGEGAETGGLRSGGSGRWRGRDGRVSGGSAGGGEGVGAGHDVDLDLHASGAVARESADEVAGARGGEGDGVVAGVVGGDGIRVGAGVVVRLAHLHHVVRLG